LPLDTSTCQLDPRFRTVATEGLLKAGAKGKSDRERLIHAALAGISIAA